jgi:hypothetical protein
MATIRKRAWQTRDGKTKEAWIVSYTDQKGGRHIETFPLRREAAPRMAATFDRYGHLWPSPEDDQSAMRQLQARVLG